VSVSACIALLKAEVERKLASALIVFSAGPRFESSDLLWYSRRWTRSAAAAAGSRTRSSYWNRL
jgi:hypothetical protein